jgi:hypothetical protein
VHPLTRLDTSLLHSCVEEWRVIRVLAGGDIIELREIGVRQAKYARSDTIPHEICAVDDSKLLIDHSQPSNRDRVQSDSAIDDLSVAVSENLLIRVQLEKIISQLTGCTS